MPRAVPQRREPVPALDRDRLDAAEPLELPVLQGHVATVYDKSPRADSAVACTVREDHLAVQWRRGRIAADPEADGDRSRFDHCVGRDPRNTTAIEMERPASDAVGNPTRALDRPVECPS